MRVGRAHAAADFKAVDARQHDVEQRDAHIGILAELFQRLLARLGLHDLVAGADQIDDDKAADAGLILQDQHFFHRISVPFSVFARRPLGDD